MLNICIRIGVVILEVNKFLSWPIHNDVNVSQKIINNWIEEYNNNTYNWAIELNLLMKQ